MMLYLLCYNERTKQWGMYGVSNVKCKAGGGEEVRMGEWVVKVIRREVSKVKVIPEVCQSVYQDPKYIYIYIYRGLGSGVA